MLRRLPLGPILLTLCLLASRVLRVAPIGDPLGGDLPPGLHLRFPPIALVFSPLFDLWDSVSMLSMSRLTGFTAGLLLLYLLWRVLAAARRRRREPDAGPPIGLLREAGILLVSMASLVAFVAGGLLWRRPMAALRGAPSNTMVVDFHSHTNASHDVKGTLMANFDATSNQRWHGKAGFDAAFVTDHNTVEGLPSPKPGSRPLLCPGIEVSAWRAHIVLPGARVKVDRTHYASSLDGVLALLRESDRKFGAPSIVSLPEYDRNHWANLDAFVEAGADGFEIVNASPKANEFSKARRDSIIALARMHGLFLVGVSDSHGWGATSMVWNLVQVPGWRAATHQACALLLRQLRAGGIESVQIAERHRLRPDSSWPWIVTPVGVMWETWRALSPMQTLSWGVWIWLVGVAAAYSRRA